MNYDVGKNTVSVNHMIFDGCQESPIDIEFSLPDYCPDIQRILKCHVSPEIDSRNISGDRLNIEGTINIHLIYLDPDKMQIRCCENSSSFSSSIDIKSNPENAFPTTSIKLGYLNCRATSPRKIDIHGAFSICAKVYGKEDIEIPSHINGEDIEQKVLNITASDLVGIGQQQFSINEVLDLGQGNFTAEKIIRSSANFNLEDYKYVSGKIAIKGEVILRILFLGSPDTDQIDSMEYSIPVSQIVDVPGVDENSKCVINVELLSHNEKITNESQDENLISVDIKAVATIMAYEDKEVNLVTDAYSTEFNIETTNDYVRVCKLEDTLNDTFSSKINVELPDIKVSKIIDSFADIITSSAYKEDDKIKITGKASLYVFGVDSESIPFYIERIIDIDHERPFTDESADNLEIYTKLVPSGVNYRIVGSDSLEIKIDFKLLADVFSCTKHNVVTEASTDSQTPKAKDTSSGLTIYYTEEGENIWDIARKYYTCEDLIKKENNLQSDIIEESGMLLIPMK